MRAPVHPASEQTRRPATARAGTLGDAANDITANYEWLHEHGAIAVFAYNRRNEHVDETSLLHRGYDQNGTPYAPCGRLCHSNG